MSKKEKTIPKLTGPLIETHCHLDYLKDFELAEVIEQSTQYGVEKIITISVSPENFDTVFQISQNYSHIYCSQGVHPHQASQWSDHCGDILQKRAREPKVVAIGEIGLDYHYNLSPREKQISAFEAQLEIAAKEDLPVIIHSRDADEDMMSILKKYAHTLKKKGVIHSFTSSMELAELALDLGFSLGFNGIITFNNAQNVRDVLSITPVDRILFETDAPYLTPVPFRGRPNAPFYLSLVAHKAAEVKGLDIEELSAKVYQNSLETFSLI